MNEDWSRIRELFDEALDREASEREAFLREACGDRIDLIEAVSKLLDADARQGGGPLPLEGQTPVLPRLRVLKAGERIGRFTIEGVLGRGGMGIVFSAWQDQPRRRVALKVLPQALHSQQALARFRYEAEVLGRLHHPNIAEIYEAGTFVDEDAGVEVPFFALELVEDAQPLTRFVEGSGVDLPEILGLFLQVCDAVHHGHQQGVLHRDLKPENILVGSQQRPKVIDFGIARALSAGSASRTMETQAGQILGTLQYMSPEQLDGDPDADSRADVYALGVVLFELIAGAPPHDLRDKSLTAVSRILHEDCQPSLNDRCPSLAPDIGWIVDKAMAKDRARRYESVSEFGADLRRFLAGEAVLAGPETASYRLKRFVGRNRLAVATVLLVGLSLLAFTVVAGVLWHRASRAEQLANDRLVRVQAEARTHREVADYIGEMIQSLDPYKQGKAVRVEDILDRAARDLDHVYAEKPALSVALRFRIGLLYATIGLPEKGRPLLEKALELANSHLGSDSEARVQVLSALGSLLIRTGELVRAEKLLRESLERNLALHGEEHAETMQSRYGLGNLLLRAGRADEAVVQLGRARELAEQLLGPASPEATSYTSGLALALHDQGSSSAEETARLAVERGRKHLGLDHPATQTALNNLAKILVERRRQAEAVPILEEILAFREKTFGKGSPLTITIMNNLAAAWYGLGRLEKAEHWFRRVVEAQKDSSSVPSLIMRNNLGRILQKQGKVQEAYEIYSGNLKTLDRLIAEEKLPAGHGLVPITQKGCGSCLSELGRSAEAEKLLLLAWTTRKPQKDSRHRRALVQALLEHYRRTGESEKKAAFEKEMGEADAKK